MPLVDTSVETGADSRVVLVAAADADSFEVRLDGRPLRPRPEFALSTTGSALWRRAAVAPVLRDLRTTLCFAMAARSGASVNVTLVDDRGERLSTEDLRIQGGASTCTLVSKPRTAYAPVSADRSGRIQAVAHYTGSRGVSTVALEPGRVDDPSSWR